jgi:23S rRNA pseudouridine2605 synthase
MKERLQKILSRAGYGSRRSCEKLISANRVKVNGDTAELGSKADETEDDISVDDHHLQHKPLEHIYIAFNKPNGILSEIYSTPRTKTVRDFIPLPDYLFIVGRLDKDSEGLILLTNDGELANQLTHPRYEHEKEYQVLVKREPDEKQLFAMRNGIVMQNGLRTAPAKVIPDKKSNSGFWLKIILHEGRKRQIREMGAMIGLPVLRIIRTRIGQLKLNSLKPGGWRKLTEEEVIKIKSR